ncbi:MAG: HAD family phosphatase [Pseudomonadota bacterium]
MSRIDLVIFDLDGLLVDSESLQFEAYHQVFAHHGAVINKADWPKWHRLEASAARWIEAHGLDLDAEIIRDEKKTLYEALVAQKLELKPGAAQLIDDLAQHCRLCVASGSRLESIEACLDKFALTDKFEHLFSATLLKRKKPFPDVYLQALDEMKVGAENSVSLEDSLTGLQASLAADIPCVICPDSFYPREKSAFKGALAIVDSLEELNYEVLQNYISTV